MFFYFDYVRVFLYMYTIYTFKIYDYVLLAVFVLYNVKDRKRCSSAFVLFSRKVLLLFHGPPMYYAGSILWSFNVLFFAQKRT